MGQVSTVRVPHPALIPASSSATGWGCPYISGSIFQSAASANERPPRPHWFAAALIALARAADFSSAFPPIDARPSARGEALASSSNPFRKGSQLANGCRASPPKHVAAARAVKAPCARPPRPVGGRKPLVFGALQPPSEAHRARCAQTSNGSTRCTRPPLYDTAQAGTNRSSRRCS